MSSSLSSRSYYWKLRSIVRRRVTSYVLCGFTLCLAVVCLQDGVGYHGNVQIPAKTAEVENPSFFSRHLLLELANCTPPAIEKFPQFGIFDQETRRHGAVILHMFIAIYMFLGLAIVCDEYFVPACEAICDAMNLQDDVAGATFMAAGSSAPELATTVIGVFITKDDIALGAVVGSAVFNVMLVPGLCAVFALSVVYLRWWPLFRDSLFYTISILALVFCIYDEKIVWYEAMVLILLYVTYIVLMIFNPSIDCWMTSRCTCFPLPPGTEAAPLPIKDANMALGLDSVETDDSGDETEFQTLMQSKQNGHTDPDAAECKVPPFNGTPANGEKLKALDDDGPESPFDIPDGCFKRFIWVIGLPLAIIMFITVPDCRRQRFKKCFIITFIMSIVWIGAFSYLMVWMITVVGHTLNIPDTVMGLTFIAAGSSVPDAIASLIVIREGLGDMAISNAVGSNVFDILLCLGLPWLLQTTLGDERDGIEVYSAGLTYSALTLLSTVVFLLVATHLNRWRLTKTYGIILIVVYGLFNILASMYELNIFGYVHPPECSSDF